MKLYISIIVVLFSLPLSCIENHPISRWFKQDIENKILTVTAAPQEVSKKRQGKWFPIFEIYNKSQNPVIITVKQANMSSGSTVEVKHVFEAALDMKKQFTVSIQEGIKTVNCTVSPENKNIYLTWDDKGTLRQQTGPLFGIKGVTESGLLLKSGATKEEIARMMKCAS